MESRGPSEKKAPNSEEQKDRITEDKLGEDTQKKDDTSTESETASNQSQPTSGHAERHTPPTGQASEQHRLRPHYIQCSFCFILEFYLLGEQINDTENVSEKTGADDSSVKSDNKEQKGQKTVHYISSKRSAVTTALRRAFRFH